MGNGRVMSPNRYRVTLSASDHERLVPWENPLTNSLAELVQDSLDENRWETIGDVEVYLARDEQLHTGVFGVASRMEAGAPPRRRPHDSLSLPIVPGQPLGEDPPSPPARAPPPRPPGPPEPLRPGAPADAGPVRAAAVPGAVPTSAPARVRAGL